MYLSSSSTICLRLWITSSPSVHFLCNDSTSYFLSAFYSILLVIYFKASLASSCFCFSNILDSYAFFDSSSTNLLASYSLDKPAVKCFDYPPLLDSILLKIYLKFWIKFKKVRGEAPN
jgi:hypothetical protein